MENRTGTRMIKIPVLSAEALARQIGPYMDQCIDHALAPGHRAMVFFRADDIAVPGAGFARLLDLFGRHQTPLALAVVPAWLTAARWRTLQRTADKNGHLWCWPQHGWRHAHHAPQGKKQEFGPSRPSKVIATDLEKGKRRLECILGADFTPVFTPPWNRCGATTLALLVRSGFIAVSRFVGAEPLVPRQLSVLDLHVDLHTRKAPEGRSPWAQIVDELGRALARGRCGIMIHHRRMGENDFVFLDLLLAVLEGHRQVVRASFAGMAASGFAVRH